MANINVRAKDDTIELLKEISEKTRDSQSQVIDKALIVYNEYLKLQENTMKEIIKSIGK